VIGSFVGVVPLSSGGILEILPKCFSGPDGPLKARRALLRMVSRIGSLPVRVLEKAAQEKVPVPFHKTLISVFLDSLEKLLGYGLVSGYIGVLDKRRVLRGKIDIGRQLRLREFLPDSFWTRAAEYREDRPENRLIRSALDALVHFAGGMITGALFG
jgi:5-methylcytosine-specific restriction enzyme subunit McrC